jgi:hypothetical protein
MGYAKQLGKQYNAESAWNSLGTSQNEYESQSQLPKYKRMFDSISEINLPRINSNWDVGFRLSPQGRQSSISNPQAFVESLYSKINTYPEQMLSNGLAGRYMVLF